LVITIFGSAFTSPDNQIYKDAELLGSMIAKKDFAVCSGGYLGIMEAVSKGAAKENARLYGQGKVIGVTVKEWNKPPNEFLTEEIPCNNLMERILKLIELGDAYLVFKGGTGTLVEIATTLELMNKNVLKEKQMFFYQDIWKPVIETLKKDSERLKELIERNVKFISSPDELQQILQNKTL